MNESSTLTNASCWRRLAAMIYDSFLLVALWMLATCLLLFFRKGHAIEPGNLAYQGSLLTIWALFYLGFWRKGGQTLGMRAWHIQLISTNKAPLTSKQLVIRLIMAFMSFTLLLGLGFLWMLFQQERLTFYDSLSKTAVIHLASSK